MGNDISLEIACAILVFPVPGGPKRRMFLPVMPYFIARSGVEFPITSENIKVALKSSHPSITEDQMKKYYVFMEKYAKKI